MAPAKVGQVAKAGKEDRVEIGLRKQPVKVSLPHSPASLVSKLRGSKASVASQRLRNALNANSE